MGTGEHRAGRGGHAGIEPLLSSAGFFYRLGAGAFDGGISVSLEEMPTVTTGALIHADWKGAVLYFFHSNEMFLFLDSFHLDVCVVMGDRYSREYAETCFMVSRLRSGHPRGQHVFLSSQHRLSWNTSGEHNSSARGICQISWIRYRLSLQSHKHTGGMGNSEYCI